MQNEDIFDIDFDEEAEKKRKTIINDIEKVGEDELEDVDVLEKAKKDISVSKNHNPIVMDIEPNLGVLSLWEKQKISISKLDKKKKNIDSLTYKNRKIGDVSLKWYKPKKDKYTINAIEIENTTSKQKGSTFDLWVGKKESSEVIKIRSKKLLSKLSTKFYKTIKNTFIISTAILLVSLTLLLYKETLVNSLYSGLNNLEKIKTADSLKEARKLTNNAKKDFLVSGILLYPIDTLLNNKIYSIDKMKLISEVHSWGKALINGVDKGFFIAWEYEDIIKNKNLNDILFTELLTNTEPHISYVIGKIKDSHKSFENAVSIIDKNPLLLDEKISNKLKKETKNIESKLYYLSDTENIVKDIKKALGHEKKKTYYIAFQNNNEIRPTGGFMGSWGFVSLFKGKVTDFETKDIYALEYLMKPFTEPAPKWISELTPTFGLRDANYYVDFEKSSNEIQKHLHKIWREVDWVLFINLSSILPYLEAIWPVFLPESNTTFDHKNFAREMSILVESKKFQTHTTSSPKDILFIFIEKFAKKIKNYKNTKDLAKITYEIINSREIFLSLNDKKLQNSINKIQNPYYSSDTVDYIIPYFTSISWNKSDRYIRRSYDIKIEKTWVCEYKNTFTVRLKHTFWEWDLQKIKKSLTLNEIDKSKWDELIYIQWNWRNRSLFKAEIPDNVSLKWYKEKIMQTEKWKESKHNFSYEYSLQNCENWHSFTLYKQPGIPSYSLNIDYLWTKISKIFSKDFTIKEHK